MVTFVGIGTMFIEPAMAKLDIASISWLITRSLTNVFMICGFGDFQLVNISKVMAQGL